MTFYNKRGTVNHRKTFKTMPINAVSEKLFKFRSNEYGISVVSDMILGLFLKLSIFK